MFETGYLSSRLYIDTLFGLHGRSERVDSSYRVIPEKEGLFARLKGLFTKKEKKD